MAVPTTPVVSGATDIYSMNDTIALSWVTLSDVTSCNVKVYEQTGYGTATLVVDTSATDTLMPLGNKLWEWTAGMSSFATDGGHYFFRITATNASGTSDPASETFEVYANPTVTLAPFSGTTVTDLPLTVSWVISSSTGVSRQSLHIADSSDPTKVLYDSRWPSAISPDTRGVILYANDLNGIIDGGSYVIELAVTNGVGLVTVAQSTFDTSWQVPGTPSIELLEQDEELLSVTITVHAVPQTTATVWRVIDGNRSEVGSGSDLFDVTDPLPPLGVSYEYEVIAVNDQTGVTSSPAVVSTRFVTDKWVFNCAHGAALVQTLRRNPTASWSMKHGGDLYHFADGGAGGGLPRFYPTSERNQSGTLSFYSIRPRDVDIMRKRSMDHPVMWIRSPFGHRWRAHVMPSYTREIGCYWKLSISWEAVRWEEAS